MTCQGSAMFGSHNYPGGPGQVRSMMMMTILTTWHNKIFPYLLLLSIVTIINPGGSYHTRLVW